MKKSILAVQQQVMPGYTGQVFSFGNQKLPNNTMIANLSSATNCPSKALGLCKVASICYAFHGEKRWPNVLKKNLAVEQWIQSASEQDIIRLLEAYISAAPSKIEYLRLNEAGDFVSQNQVDLWESIAEYLEKNHGIKTYTYTARADLDFSEAQHIVVNGSLPGIKGAVREFHCTPAKTFDTLVISKGEYKCPGDCHKCHVCFSGNFKGVIYCRKH